MPCVCLFVALSSFLQLSMVHGLPQSLPAHKNLLTDGLRLNSLRALQDSSDVPGCRWTGQSCTASGAYFADTGAFYELYGLLEQLEECSQTASCEDAACKTIEIAPGESACVNQASNMNSESKDALFQLLSPRDFTQFRDDCPLAEALDGDASQDCKSGWALLVDVTGCTSCTDDIDFFENKLKLICSQLLDQGSCESSAGTRYVGEAVCDHAHDGAALDSDESAQACADTHLDGGQANSGLGTGAIAGIAIAAIVATIAIAALIAWLILRSPASRNSKKRAAAAAGAAPPAPGTDPAAHGMHATASEPYGAQSLHANQPPMPYGYGQQPSNQSAGMPAGAGGPAGMGMPRIVPTDVYPSAEQYMASGLGHESQTGAARSGGVSYYGSARAPSAHGVGGGGSMYGGSAFGVPEVQVPATQGRDPAELARLPARDVLVQQIARTGDPAHMFSIGTRAAWDATAAGTMPSPTTTGSSKPEEVLEAQLDYVAHQLGGSLLEDSQVGAWVMATGLQQRISERSAVVFVHARDEPEAAAAPGAAVGRRLRALKFFFAREDFDRNVAASNAPELRGLMPAVERVEGDASNLGLPTVPAPLNQHPLPQLLINDRGETLDEHVTRTKPNFVAALSIMIQLAQVIERLHSAGWVHRDLKPSNCLFLAQPARWALIDWSCAAKTGTPADVSFSLYYAPPEVVHAYTSGQKEIHSHPSTDVWSLGVMAWELFTGRKFYGPAPDLQFVVKALGGEQPLPSEIELAPDIKKRLGNSMFRATFLSMLHRDPQQRPSVRQLLASWESFFSQTRPT